MRKVTTLLPTLAWSGLILVLVAVAMGVLPWLTSRAEPTFTGDAPADFIDADTIFVPDPDGVGNVGLPPTAPAGTSSGWDLAGVYFDYDHATDTMYVGFDCVGICGDADGDGDAGGTGAWLAAQGGSDLANLSGDEAVVLLIDTNNDGSAEVAVGVNDASDITAFGAYNRTPTGFARPSDASRWGIQLPNPFSLYANPSTVSPDLEFSIGSFSTLPNFSFTPGEGFSFEILAYAGSESDDGIRDESFRATVNVPSLAAFGDLVWEDLDGDGLQDTGEPGVANVTASLFDCTGAFISTTLTTASGHYTFTMLEVGDYYAEFVIPEGYNSSPQDQGTDDTIDSDADPITRQTACTTLSMGESDPTWDAGIWRTASIGDYVWEDLDADGVQEGGEPAVTGVTTNLYDCTGALIDSTTSDASGFYTFTNLIPGDYYAEFILPGGWALTLRDQGTDDAVDSDADPGTGETICTTLTSGEYDPSWDAGMFQLLTLGDRVWYDTDQDGIQDGTEPGVQNVTVDLYDDGSCAGTSIASDVTDASGVYGFSDLSPGTYCLQFSDIPAGWFVSLPDQGGDDTADSDADPGTGRITGINLSDNDPNADMGVYAVGSMGDTAFCDADGNGSFDAGEGVAGVTISLYEDPECDSDPDALLTNQDTAGDGQYLFNGLAVGPPSGPPICYVVQADAADMGTCNHPLTPTSYDVPLNADNPNDLDNDFGFTELLTLGDRVWYDTDQDGIQDTTEAGVQNVTVDLYDNGTCAGTSIASGVTDASGAYGFSDLSPGTYCLQFTDIPAGWFVTLQDQGGDNTADSDADPGTGRITGISLAANDPTADMGVYTVGSIGDTVFCDANGNGSYDAGEGVAGVTISLYADPECDTSSDALLDNQDTIGDGQYLFGGLSVGPPSGPPICYIVRVDIGDMDSCSDPITGAQYGVSLDADNPDDSGSDFGFDQMETDHTVYLPLILRP